MAGMAYPKCGFDRVSKRVERVLLLCCFDRNGVPSVVEILEFIQRVSRFPVTVLNLYEHRTVEQFLALPADYDLSAFSCIIIHNTVSYNPDNLFSLDKHIAQKLSDYPGVKILLKQDDHHRFRDTAEFIEKKRIDVVFSLTPTTELEKVYNIAGAGASIEVNHMLAGYVSPQMRTFFYSKDRPVDVGYRGSIMPLAFGRLCYEKRKIGDDVASLLRARRGLVLDISSRWEDRLGGARWYEFLKNAKSVLGVESGSGVFDLNGNLADKCKAIEEKLGPFRLDHSYAEAYLAELSEFEGNVKYFMISPRHFEAISCGSVQILFPGAYTDRMIADRHYFELRRDYKNLNEIVEKLLDPKVRCEFAERAFEEVILDQRNWIETFVEQLDDSIERNLAIKGVSASNSVAVPVRRDVHNVLLIQAHEYGADPRRDQWIPNGANEKLLVHQLVIDRGAKCTKITTTQLGGTILSVPYQAWRSNSFDGLASNLGVLDPVLTILAQLKNAVSLGKFEFAELFGAPVHSPRLDAFRWYLVYILNTTESLMCGLSGVRGYSAVVAVNLPTLLVAVIAKRLYGVGVVYEALEYWPEADPDSGQFEIDFWCELEKTLVKYADFSGTVSPGLAKLMGELYGVSFGVLPNCCPLSEGVSDSRGKEKEGPVRFLYQGNFSPYRGLEELIDAFASDDVSGILLLRGADCEYKLKLIDRAKSKNLLDKKVLFLEIVSPTDLVSTAHHSGDVGVIPYMPMGENYKNCSPNKMGQYFAANVPILANRTDFVSQVIEESGAGIVVDFSDREALVRAIAKMSNNRRLLEEYSEKSRLYYLQSFNWDVLSKDFYRKIEVLCDKSQALDRFGVYDKKNFGLYRHPVKQSYSDCVVLTQMKRTWRKLPLRFRYFFKPLLRKIINRSSRA